MRKWQTGTKWLGAGTQRFSPLGHLFKLSQSAQIRLEQLFACFAAKGHGFKSEYSVPPPLTHVLEGSTESAWIQALPSPREVASPSQGEACGRGSRGVAALSLTVEHLCCGDTEEAAGLPGQPFSRALNSHYRREVDNSKNHEFIEKEYGAYWKHSCKVLSSLLSKRWSFLA